MRRFFRALVEIFAAMGNGFRVSNQIGEWPKGR